MLVNMQTSHIACFCHCETLDGFMIKVNKSAQGYLNILPHISSLPGTQPLCSIAMHDKAVNRTSAFTDHMWQSGLSLTNSPSCSSNCNESALLQADCNICCSVNRVKETAGCRSCKFLVLQALLPLCWGPVSDCLRLSYIGPLEEAVCLHTSLCLHRLLLYIKIRALL